VGVGCEPPPVTDVATEAFDAGAAAATTVDGAGVELTDETSGIGVLDRIAAALGSGVATVDVATVLEDAAANVAEGVAGAAIGAGVT
jgi:hypothetical protein